jgi:hypothetical protein
MEVVRTSETSVDNYFTRQYIPEDNSEQNQFSCFTRTNSKKDKLSCEKSVKLSLHSLNVFCKLRDIEILVDSIAVFFFA